MLPDDEIKDLTGAANTHESGHGTNTSHTETTTTHENRQGNNTSQAATPTESAKEHHEKVKRDVFNIIQLEDQQTTNHQQTNDIYNSPISKTNINAGSTIWYTTILSFFFTAVPAIESSHSLIKRAEIEVEDDKGSFTQNITMGETVFVYKTFLIFAGLILVINSMIKSLNTKKTGKLTTQFLNISK